MLLAREGDPYLNRLSPYIRVLETPAETRDLSSTKVRSLVREIRGKQAELARMVPPELLDMIV